MAATVVSSISIVRSGWMRKVVPSHIGPTKARFFVLYDSGNLHYYDSEKLEPEHLMGKLHLGADVEAIVEGSELVQKEGTKKARELESIKVLVLQTKGRMANWQIDAGSDENRSEWEAKLREAMGANPVVVVNST